jgi:selenide,water dikinase
VAERSGARLCLAAADLPLYDGALAAAEAGVRTGGDPRNRAHLEGRVTSMAPQALEALAYDPQTSGGLLAAVPPDAVDRLRVAGFVPIGAVEPGPAGVALA